MGYLHIFDLATGTLIFMNKVSEDRDTIFTTVPVEATGGLIGINRKGQVLSISINDATIIPYITGTISNVSINKTNQKKKNPPKKPKKKKKTLKWSKNRATHFFALMIIGKQDFELAIKMAARANLPGAEDLFTRQFQTFFQQGRFQDAARVAAESPNQFLRTQNTIRLFQSVRKHFSEPKKKKKIRQKKIKAKTSIKIFGLQLKNLLMFFFFFFFLGSDVFVFF